MKHTFKKIVYCIAVALALISCGEEQDNKKKESGSSEKIVSSSVTLKKEKVSQELQEVNVYSSRLPDLVKPIFDLFTQQTGIKVNFIFLKQGALERLKSEGEFTPADLILVSDIGSIYDIMENDLVSPIKSAIIHKNIPENYRSQNDLWVGLTGRIRMLARTTKELPIDIHGYDALSDPKLKGRVCSRSLTHPYNVALIASYLHEHGQKATEKWLRDFRNNIFDKPSGDDTGQINLIASGLCDVAPVNHYYYERMIKLDKNLSKKVKLVPLVEMKQGVYANISGVLISKYATNYDNAVKLIEFMTEPAAQEIFVKYDYEFPLNKKVAFKSDLFNTGIDNIKSLPLDVIAGNRQKALEIIYKLQ